MEARDRKGANLPTIYGSMPHASSATQLHLSGAEYLKHINSYGLPPKQSSGTANIDEFSDMEDDEYDTDFQPFSHFQGTSFRPSESCANSDSFSSDVDEELQQNVKTRSGFLDESPGGKAEASKGGHYNMLQKSELLDKLKENFQHIGANHPANRTLAKKIRSRWDARPSPLNPNRTIVGVASDLPISNFCQNVVNFKKLPDGKGIGTHPSPKIDCFVYDPVLKLRFDPTTGLHYDANCGLFYNSVSKIALFYHEPTKRYLLSDSQSFLNIGVASASPSNKSDTSMERVREKEKSRSPNRRKDIADNSVWEDRSKRRRSQSRSLDRKRSSRSPKWRSSATRRSRSRSRSNQRWSRGNPSAKQRFSINTYRGRRASGAASTSKKERSPQHNRNRSPTKKRSISTDRRSRRSRASKSRSRSTQRKRSMSGSRVNRKGNDDSRVSREEQKNERKSSNRNRSPAKKESSSIDGKSRRSRTAKSRSRSIPSKRSRSTSRGKRTGSKSRSSPAPRHDSRAAGKNVSREEKENSKKSPERNRNRSPAKKRSQSRERKSRRDTRADSKDKTVSRKRSPSNKQRARENRQRSKLISSDSSSEQTKPCLRVTDAREIICKRLKLSEKIEIGTAEESTKQEESTVVQDSKTDEQDKKLKTEEGRDKFFRERIDSVSGKILEHDGIQPDDDPPNDPKPINEEAEVSVLPEAINGSPGSPKTSDHKALIADGDREEEQLNSDLLDGATCPKNAPNISPEVLQFETGDDSSVAQPFVMIDNELDYSADEDEAKISPDECPSPRDNNLTSADVDSQNVSIICGDVRENQSSPLHEDGTALSEDVAVQQPEIPVPTMAHNSVEADVHAEEDNVPETVSSHLGERISEDRSSDKNGDLGSAAVSNENEGLKTFENSGSVENPKINYCDGGNQSSSETDAEILLRETTSTPSEPRCSSAQAEDGDAISRSSDFSDDNVIDLFDEDDLLPDSSSDGENEEEIQTNTSCANKEPKTTKSDRSESPRDRPQPDPVEMDCELEAVGVSDDFDVDDIIGDLLKDDDVVSSSPNSDSQALVIPTRVGESLIAEKSALVPEPSTAAVGTSTSAVKTSATEASLVMEPSSVRLEPPVLQPITLEPESLKAELSASVPAELAASSAPVLDPSAAERSSPILESVTNEMPPSILPAPTTESSSADPPTSTMESPGAKSPSPYLPLLKQIENWSGVPLNVIPVQLKDVKNFGHPKWATNFILAVSSTSNYDPESALLRALAKNNVVPLQIMNSNVYPDGGFRLPSWHIIFESPAIALNWFLSCNGSIALDESVEDKKTISEDRKPDEAVNKDRQNSRRSPSMNVIRLHFSVGNWKCSSCGAINFTLRFLCHACLSTKQGIEYSPIRLVESRRRLLALISRGCNLRGRTIIKLFPKRPKDCEKTSMDYLRLADRGMGHHEFLTQFIFSFPDEEECARSLDSIRRGQSSVDVEIDASFVELRLTPPPLAGYVDSDIFLEQIMDTDACPKANELGANSYLNSPSVRFVDFKKSKLAELRKKMFAHQLPLVEVTDLAQLEGQFNVPGAENGWCNVPLHIPSDVINYDRDTILGGYGSSLELTYHYRRQPTNYVLIRFDKLNLLRKNLPTYLSEKGVDFAKLIVTTPGNCGAPANYVHVVFQTYQAALEWYLSCKGLISFHGPRISQVHSLSQYRNNSAFLYFSLGNWKCISCGKFNFTLRFYCFNCLTSKLGTEYSPFVLSNTPSRIIAVLRSNHFIRNVPEFVWKCSFYWNLTDPVTNWGAGCHFFEYESISESVGVFTILRRADKKTQNIFYVKVVDALMPGDYVLTQPAKNRMSSQPAGDDILKCDNLQSGIASPMESCIGDDKNKWENMQISLAVLKPSTLIGQTLTFKECILNPQPVGPKPLPVGPGTYEHAKLWSGVDLLLSPETSCPSHVKTPWHGLSKYFLQHPSNFVLATSLLKSADLNKYLACELDKGKIEYEKIIESDPDDWNIPFDYCYVIFGTYQAALDWYSSCDGMLDASPPNSNLDSSGSNVFLHFSTGDWICSACNDRNFTLRYLCGSCYSSKQGFDYSPIRLVRKPTQIIALYPYTDRIVEGQLKMRPCNKFFNLLLEAECPTDVELVDPVSKLTTGLTAFRFESIAESREMFEYFKSNRTPGSDLMISYVQLVNSFAPYVNPQIASVDPLQGDSGTHCASTCRIRDARDIILQRRQRQGQSLNEDEPTSGGDCTSQLVPTLVPIWCSAKKRKLISNHSIQCKVDHAGSSGTLWASTTLMPTTTMPTTPVLPPPSEKFNLLRLLKAGRKAKRNRKRTKYERRRNQRLRLLAEAEKEVIPAEVGNTTTESTEAFDDDCIQVVDDPVPIIDLTDD